ncbi:hypothetical protein CsSME_00011343 [Camellia sinensis var. sinensis]
MQSKVGLDDTNFPLSEAVNNLGLLILWFILVLLLNRVVSLQVRILEQESEQGGIVAMSSERGLTVGLVAVRIVRLICLVLRSTRMINPRRRSSFPKECIWARTSSSLIVTRVRALQSGGSFQLLHRQSLSVVEVRIRGHSDPILQDVVVDIEMEAPSLDILPTSSQSCEETLQPSPPNSPTLQPSSLVLSDCEMEEQAPTTGKASLSDNFMFCFAGRSKRICASIPRCPKSSKLIFDITAGKRKREPRIEDSYSDPSLFRPPRRRAFRLG